MFLVIGEKPSVSQALAKILKAEKREDGYLNGMQSGILQIYPLSRRNGSWPWQRIKRHSLQS